MGRRFFEEGEGDDAVDAAIRVGRRHKVNAPINRQRRPDTYVGQSLVRFPNPLATGSWGT